MLLNNKVIFYVLVRAPHKDPHNIFFMGCCFSREVTNEPTPKQEANEPMITGKNETVDALEILEKPIPLLGDNKLSFKKTTVSDSGSDIDTKELNQMMKSDEDVNIEDMDENELFEEDVNEEKKTK